MRALLLFLALAACSAGPQDAFNPHTGVASRASRVQLLDWRSPSRFEVRAVRLSLGTEDRFALLTFVTRSDLNFPRIESAWSLGRPLPYERVDRRRVGNDRQEAGMIPMTQAEAERAARGGLAFQLIGLRGTYEGIADPALFASILEK